jgi:hypothetical protein
MLFHVVMFVLLWVKPFPVKTGCGIFLTYRWAEFDKIWYIGVFVDALSRGDVCFSVGKTTSGENQMWNFSNASLDRI